MTTPLRWPLYGLIVARTAGSGLTFPAPSGLMTSRVEPDEQGALMGVKAALMSVVTVLGPLVAGVAFDRVAPDAPY